MHYLIRPTIPMEYKPFLLSDGSSMQQSVKTTLKEWLDKLTSETTMGAFVFAESLRNKAHKTQGGEWGSKRQL